MLGKLATERDIQIMENDMYRGYRVEIDSNTRMFCVKPPKSGKIAYSLSGRFTNILYAKQAIDRHLNSLKGKRNVKVKTNS